MTQRADGLIPPYGSQFTQICQSRFFRWTPITTSHNSKPPPATTLSCSKPSTTTLTCSSIIILPLPDHVNECFLSSSPTPSHPLPNRVMGACHLPHSKESATSHPSPSFFPSFSKHELSGFPLHLHTFLTWNRRPDFCGPPLLFTASNTPKTNVYARFQGFFILFNIIAIYYCSTI